VNRYPKRDDLRAMSGYHSPQVSVKVRLNTNESPIEPPAEFVRELAAAVNEVRWNRYPDRAARELRSAIAAMHKVSPDNVFVANGSNEVLQSVLLAYSGAGRSVATFEPTYQLHTHIARIAGATVVHGKRNADFTLSETEVQRVLAEHQPSVTFLCSPNNPTGMAEDPAIIASTIKNAPGVVVVDEAYAQFSPHSALQFVSEDSRVAVSRTFSKTWSMAAARLGYLIAPAWMIEDLEIVTLPYHLDALKQVAGTNALKYLSEMCRSRCGRARRTSSCSGRTARARLHQPARPRTARARLHQPAQVAPYGNRCSTGEFWCVIARRGKVSPIACASPSAHGRKTTHSSQRCATPCRRETRSHGPILPTLPLHQGNVDRCVHRPRRPGFHERVHRDSVLRSHARSVGKARRIPLGRPSKG